MVSNKTLLNYTYGKILLTVYTGDPDKMWVLLPSKIAKILLSFI